MVLLIKRERDCLLTPEIFIVRCYPCGISLKWNARRKVFRLPSLGIAAARIIKAARWLLSLSRDVVSITKVVATMLAACLKPFVAFYEIPSNEEDYLFFVRGLHQYESFNSTPQSTDLGFNSFDKRLYDEHR